MKLSKIIKFREYLRKFEQELQIQNTSSCCCGVSLSQCHVLMELEKDDNVTLKVLSEKMNLDKSTLSRSIDGLVKSGLVSRDIPKENRRTVLLKLTEHGTSVCKKINNENNRYYESVLNELTKKEFNTFFSIFERITNNMAELNNKNNCEYNEQ